MTGMPRHRPVPALRMIRLIAVAAAAGLILGCGGDDDPPRMSGAWEGAGPEWEVRLTLLDTGERLTGSGYLAEDTASYAVGVSNGLHVHPDVTLTLVPSDGQSVNFQGRFVDDHTVEGLLNGWRFHDLPLTLMRVP